MFPLERDYPHRGYNSLFIENAIRQMLGSERISSKISKTIDLFQFCKAFVKQMRNFGAFAILLKIFVECNSKKIIPRRKDRAEMKMSFDDLFPMVSFPQQRILSVIARKKERYLRPRSEKGKLMRPGCVGNKKSRARADAFVVA